MNQTVVGAVWWGPDEYRVGAVWRSNHASTRVKGDGPNKSTLHRMRLFGLLVLLAAARALGAVYFLVHDCDEVYNYWEPLHFLVNGTGMQTWEYSSRYALRPYLYLLVHWPIAKAFSIMEAPGAASAVAFYAVRACLAAVSWMLEARLVRATQKQCSPTAAAFLAVLLAFSTGTFFASPALLPSTFSMYCMISATTGILNHNLPEVIMAAVLGTVLGWSPAAVAFVPFAVYVLLSPKLPQSVAVLIGSAAVLTSVVAVTDWYFYGRPTVSVVNFLQYNVAGGGESALYGMEPASYYIYNAVLNFGVAFPAALAYIATATLALLRLTSARVSAQELTAVSPLYIMLPALLALPHKEERFLAVIYPQFALGAALALAAAPRIVSDMFGSCFRKPKQAARDALRQATLIAVACVVGASCLMMVSRSVAQIRYYSAPTQAWQMIAELGGSSLAQTAGDVTAVRVRACVGAEWHRFSSSFFLPHGMELAFVEFGETGQLPKAFDASGLGTRASPDELRDRNKKDDRLLLLDASSCSIWVGTDEEAQPAGPWVKIFESEFVNRSESPFPDRAFWLPWRESRNHVVKYIVLSR
eukprot:jgi/Ulvmu1/10245/UM060_0046.1